MKPSKITPPRLIEIVGKNKRSQAIGNYLCTCGKHFEALEYNIKSGHTKSCGCMKSTLLRAARERHDESRPQTIEYRIWSGMKTRCQNPTSTSYPRYGGRGITVCAEWDASYEAFLSDVGRRPTPRHTLERIDNSRGYEAGNVVWATATEQARNRRSSRIIEFGGRRACLQEWAESLGISQSSLWERLEKWPLERALTQPKKSRREA